MKKNIKISYSLFIIMGILLISSNSCKKDNNSQLSGLPVLTTDPVINITSYGAISGGNITSDSGSAILFRGICWSTHLLPLINDTKAIDASSGIGHFVCNIGGLKDSTTYYVRAYAVNSNGTAYGNTRIFTTQNPLLLGDGDLRVYFINDEGFFFAFAPVYLYKSVADRTNDPNRQNYYQMTTTGDALADPTYDGAHFYPIPYGHYYVYCTDTFQGKTYNGLGDTTVPNGLQVNLVVHIKH